MSFFRAIRNLICACKQHIHIFFVLTVQLKVCRLLLKGNQGNQDDTLIVKSGYHQGTEINGSRYDVTGVKNSHQVSLLTNNIAFKL
jgi:hypothetical protein